MKVFENGTYQGERPLFKTFDAVIKNCKFLAGESPVKESRNLIVEDSSFSGKYPFWHNRNLKIDRCHFTEGGRAAIWYTEDVEMSDSRVDAPKIFRDAKNIIINRTDMVTEETLWDCENVRITDSKFKGNYLFLHSSNIELKNFELDGNYSFQHVKGGVIRNSVLRSKDAFWNSENITVYDSTIDGEYLGWYSKNLRLVNCKIMGTQPLCYCENLVLENCEMIDTDLAFEYSSVNASITNVVDSIKNPKSGVIKVAGVKQIIQDEEDLDHSKVRIITINN